MNNMNSILIEGCLVKDPEIKTTPKGTQVCNFSIATNRYYKEDGNIEKEESFFEIKTWAKLAESCYSIGHQGRGCRVVGRLAQERWNDVDGKPQSKIYIAADHVEFRPDFKKKPMVAPMPDPISHKKTTSDKSVEERNEEFFAFCPTGKN